MTKMLEKRVTSQMKHMHLYYVRIIYTHINIMKTHIHVNHPTIFPPKKNDKTLPFQSTLVFDFCSKYEGALPRVTAR